MAHDKKIHTSAAALIVAAAEKSGLLREVAEALYSFNHILPTPIDNCPHDCPAEALCNALASEFDDHICTPGIVMESFFGEGFAPAAPYIYRGESK